MNIKTIHCIIILSLSLQLLAQDCVVNTCANTDLNWLQSYKDQIILEHTDPPYEPCSHSDGNILHCSYQGQSVFVMVESILDCDVPISVFDCEGNLLFSYGGYCIGQCYPDGADPNSIIDCIEIFNYQTEDVDFCPCIDPSIPITSDVVCSELFDPVCGCDGQTYPNSCQAMYYNGVLSWSTGACEPICIDTDQIDLNVSCPQNYDPVCGCDDVSYSNACHAFYFGGVTSWDEGECGCIDSLHVDSDPASGLYESRVITYSSNMVRSSKSVIFQSNGEIELEPGFEVEQAATFVAEIDACDEQESWTLGDASNGAGFASFYFVEGNSQFYIWVESNFNLCPNTAVQLGLSNATTNQTIYSEIIEMIDVNANPLEPFLFAFDVSQDAMIGMSSSLVLSQIPANLQMNCNVNGNITFEVEYIPYSGDPSDLYPD